MSPKDTRWLKMDDGKDRIVEAQVNITNNTINLSADDRRRRYPGRIARKRRSSVRGFYYRIPENYCIAPGFCAP